MELRYKTNGMGNPKGKPYVYFSCHPKDFDLAFPLVSEDILAHSNCAIWYDSALELPAEEETVTSLDEEELGSALSEMQLVVFAVTPDFIFTPNRAKDIELPYALAHHIPVLPIMMETGLGYKFSNNCAKIQVVNRIVKDPTSTPYDEVLDTFLTAVLIGDELAEKVRNAFDAYVFLSYRKKDRRHAQRLIRLIHENPEFRDIAIWYDEFLVPGEGFNEAIADAFRRSSLFVMAVTPHLEEEGNYVMRVEYPMARDRKEEEDASDEEKKFQIVPVEMYEDRDTVDGKEWRIEPANLEGHEEFKYRKIDDLQDEHRRDMLDSAFVSALMRMAKKENDGSAEHRFFIGLAYLGGIDVEVDAGKALSLIESAAMDEHPCFEATEKLVDMYKTGDGVDVDMEKAVFWQQKLISQYKGEYEKHYSPDEHKGFGTKYFKSLLKLSDMYRDQGKKEDALRTAEEALAVGKELRDEVGIREVERDTAVIENRIGGLYRELGNADEAMAYYKKARDTYERLAKEIGTARARRDLSVSLERIGDMYRKMKDLEKAEEAYARTLEIREALGKDADRPGPRRDLSSILVKYGNLKKDRKDLSGALQFYESALKIDKILMAEEKTDQAKDDYAVSLVKLGDILRKKKDYKPAWECQEEAAGIFEEIFKRTGSLRSRRNLATALEKKAKAEAGFASPETPKESFERALDIRIKVAEEVPCEDTKHELAVSYFQYGEYCEDANMVRKALEIWEELSTRSTEYEKYKEAARQLLEKLN